MTYTEAEHDMIIRQIGQGGTLRDKFTREQAVRMFKRRDADKRAASTLYQDGTSVKQHLDDLVADGPVHVIRSGRWMYLSRADGSDKPRLDSKIERDYIQVALNVGEFERNY